MLFNPNPKLKKENNYIYLFVFNFASQVNQSCFKDIWFKDMFIFLTVK